VGGKRPCPIDATGVAGNNVGPMDATGVGGNNVGPKAEQTWLPKDFVVPPGDSAELPIDLVRKAGDFSINAGEEQTWLPKVFVGPPGDSAELPIDLVKKNGDFSIIGGEALEDCAEVVVDEVAGRLDCTTSVVVCATSVACA